MANLTYIDYDEALSIYYKTVGKSGGGMAGVRDEGGIRSTLDFVQDDLYYPEISDKAAYLMYSLCKGHYFADCNKRISITLTANFFRRTGICIFSKTSWRRWKLSAIMWLLAILTVNC